MRHPPGSFGPTERLQKAYEDGIRKITGRVLKPRRPEQTLEEWLAELEERSRAKDVQQASELLATRMVRWVNVGNVKTWRDAAAKSQQSRKLFRLLEAEMRGATGEAVRRLVAENARYIRSVPVDAAGKLVEEVTRAQQRGARAGTIDKMLRTRFPKLVRSRVHLISRTETAKASLALTQARAEEVGAQFAEWLTSQDVRVRDSHRKMDKVIFAWNDPPNPEQLAGEDRSYGDYGPGGIFNCRCTSRVILSIDDITWPRRVHRNGVVRQMTKPQFMKEFGLNGESA